MPPLRTVAILALLCCMACGGKTSWSVRLDLPSAATAKTKVFVVAWRGSIAVRNSSSGQLEVSATSRTPVDWDKFMPTALAAEGGVARFVVGESAKGVELDLEIAAPPGIALTVGCADADVEITGMWGELQVSTGGALDARVDAKSGKLAGQHGPVSFVAVGPGPIGEIRVESASGDVAAAVPAAWDGQLKFQTRTGKLDVPTHARLQTIWDEDKRGVVGRMGPALPKGTSPLPTVWAVSGTGNVSFRIEE